MFSRWPLNGWNGWVTISELQAVLLASAVWNRRLDHAGGSLPEILESKFPIVGRLAGNPCSIEPQSFFTESFPARLTGPVAASGQTN